MTADITLASSGGDSAVLETIIQYQAELLGAVAVKTAAFQAAAAGGGGSGHGSELSRWVESRLVPYLRAETEVLIPALGQTAAGGELAGELSASGAELLELADRIAASTRPADTGAAAAALQILLAGHLELEAGRALPALAESSRISLPELWNDVVAASGNPTAGSEMTTSVTSKHVCECGILDDDGFPELDVCNVPHAIRHATVFGALDAVEKGSGMILIAPHDPLPLLAQIEARAPGEFAVDYLDRGPEKWRLQFLRAGAVS
ncbi:MAG TPA: DUF2249 domain-containing protein [Arthrobacter sp.]|nr:DUF2249 domain-containing protein [Arthrobacter sp.]